MSDTPGGAVDVVWHDEPPPEWSVSTVEGDLAAAARAGGLTDDESMAGPGDYVLDGAAAGVTDGTDADAVERARLWLSDHPEAVRE